MSGAYEGLITAYTNRIDLIDGSSVRSFDLIHNNYKVWSYHAYHRDCPFDDIDVGELVFAVYGTGIGVAVPDIDEPAGLPGSLTAVSEVRGTIKQFDLEPITSEYVRIRYSNSGVLRVSFSTTQDNWNQLDTNCCILLNISQDHFEPEKGLNWRNLSKTLSTAEAQQAFRGPFPLEIKKLDQIRLESLYPKEDLKEFAKCTLESGKECFENVHVILKFSRSGKTEKEWLKCQQRMGNQLLAEGLVSDFAIKAGGKTIPCHRTYLAGRSPVLARMFKSNMVDVEDETLTMEDMSAEGVEGFLSYVYTGNLVDAMASSAIALEMLRTGHKYQIKDLEFACKKILESTECKKFDAATAFEMYKCGTAAGLGSLQTKAVRVLKENAKKFTEAGEIGALSESIQSADVRKAFNDWIGHGLQSV